METILISISKSDFQTLIKDTVNDCLKNIKSIISPSESTVIWFNIDELCEYLPDKPAKQTVYGWVNKRLIPYHKKGKALSFLKSEVDNWLKEGLRTTVNQVVKEIAQTTDTYLAKKIKDVRND